MFYTCLQYNSKTSSKIMA